MWLLMGALLIMAFQSNLLASLAIIKYQPDINTLEEIYNAGKKVYLSKGIYAEKMMVNAPDKSLLRAIYDDLIVSKGGAINKPRLSKDSLFYQDLTNNKALYIIGKSHAKAHYGPIIKSSRYTLYNKQAGWLLNKNLTNKYPDLEDTMNRVMSLLFEGGIPNKLYNFYMFKMALNHLDKMEFESEEPKPLELRHILQVLTIFLVCLALSAISFAFEVFM